MEGSAFMRRLASTLGALGLAPLLACAPTVRSPIPTPEPTAPTTVVPSATPSIVASAPAPADSPTTTSYTPPKPDVLVPPAPVTPGPMRVRPISGGTLRILSDGHTAVAADSDRDQIYVVDLLAGRVSATVALNFGDEPGRVVEDADGRVHVALRGGGAVATIDPKLSSGEALLARRSLCSAPRGLAFDKSTNELHVACAGGELVSIGAAPTATTPTRTLSLGRDLRDVVVSTNGRLMVSTFRTAEVYTIDGTGTVSKPQSVSQDNLSRSSGVAWRMLEGPGGSCMLLHELSTQQQTLGTFPGAYGQQRTSCGSIVSSTVTVVAPDGSDALPALPFAGTLVGADVAVSPSGQQMAVVSIASTDPSQQVSFFDTVQNSGSPVFSPIGQCWQPSGTTPAADSANIADPGTDGLAAPGAYLPPNGQIVAIAYDPRGNVIVQSREPATLQILTQRRDAIALSQDSRFDDGQQLFHSATTGQIACVSCHPEGGEDGRVWNFQNLGARRTQSLRGGIMDTAPFHWGGDESNMTSLMKDVFQGRMAGGTVDAQRVTALAGWLDQIPTITPSHSADASSVTRGGMLFVSAGCVACHNGPDLTNGMTVDVGTGGMFQVPQLHGLAFRAPYMHNGCAATLRDRFRAGCGGDARHSAGDTLTDAQVTDLVAYLETL
jgi:DNA-binding beta-propeller fold protein YncE